MILIALIFVIALIIGLCILIGRTHDCKSKLCSHKIDPPEKDWPMDAKIERLVMMTKECDSATIWNLNLLAGFVIPFPISYYLNDRLPTFKEWFFMAFIVFIISYFFILWLQINFLRPNLILVQDALHELGKHELTES
uniref:3 transmembrane helices protein n=1 Tax=Pithovirus LCPAC403 TaxID=2506596 RepID=A0A481ZC59_9VIRU|nr:MAG: 3 transmembrane helices protein [Pithovirus LCPAC403]